MYNFKYNSIASCLLVGALQLFNWSRFWHNSCNLRLLIMLGEEAWHLRTETVDMSTVFNRFLPPWTAGKSNSSDGIPPGHPLVLVGRILCPFHHSLYWSSSSWMTRKKQNSARFFWTSSFGSNRPNDMRSSNAFIHICVQPLRSLDHQASILWFRYDGPKQCDLWNQY